jgi:hypothetical protein
VSKPEVVDACRLEERKSDVCLNHQVVRSGLGIAVDLTCADFNDMRRETKHMHLIIASLDF